MVQKPEVSVFREGWFQDSLLGKTEIPFLDIEEWSGAISFTSLFFLGGGKNPKEWSDCDQLGPLVICSFFLGRNTGAYFSTGWFNQLEGFC